MSGNGGGAIAATSGGGEAVPVLSAQGLGRTYDGYIALGSFTVEVEAGEFVALIGPNGAGKTTFLNLAAGLLDPTSGGIEVAGAAAGLARRPRGALLPARHAGLLRRPEPRRAPRIRRRPARRRGPDRADRPADRPARPRGLGGRARRRTLEGDEAEGLDRPRPGPPFDVLLADEPLDGLDPPSREVLFELLAETRAAGAAIVVSTHRPDVIAAADRCVAIRDGRLAYDGTPDPEVLTEIFDRGVRAATRDAAVRAGPG